MAQDALTDYLDAAREAARRGAVVLEECRGGVAPPERWSEQSSQRKLFQPRCRQEVATVRGELERPLQMGSHRGL